MREGTVKCLSAAGFHHMAYVEWGDPANPRVLVCVHGLTRCGRDFDFLAEVLADRYRVVCPDVVGRGRSDWLRNKSLYALPQYCADMATLLARLGAETVHWVGTSMGGLIGMLLASQPESPITRLVLNDVGPMITGLRCERIGEYLGRAPRFEDIEQAEAFVRFVSAPFGKLSGCPVAPSDGARDTLHSRRRGGVCLRSRTGPAFP
jgi:pimeloyl-ACP methyl ester carboxylesterase